ncbi:MAG: SRPBCC family protein [Bacteroidota bacterium]
MNAPNRSQFVYVTYIRTTPARLWKALTEPEFIRQYWFGTTVECDWKKGSPWKMVGSDGSLMDSGEILEIDPPRRMVIRWQNEWKPELKAEGKSRCTITLEPVDDAVKLTIVHEIDRPDSRFITAVSQGWPRIASNLKSLLEAGEIAITSHPGH